MTTPVASARRLVVKVGSSLVTNDGRGLDHGAVERWATQIAELRRAGREIVLVSSGAIAEGVKRLGWTARPSTIHEQQAAAAVGQMGLVQAYESAFARFGLHTAQILLTHDDLADRRRYLNARSTLFTLLALDVIPIINENDTVTTDEIRFGDNDTLGALVTNLIEADVLVLLTDQPGLFTADPRRDSDSHAGAHGPGGGTATRGDGRRRRQRGRSRRHAVQGAGRQARGAFGRLHRHRRRARGKRADAARGGRRDRHVARRPRCVARRAQAVAGRPRPARGTAHARCRRRARARPRRQEPAAHRRGPRRRATSSAARSSPASTPTGREVARGLVNYSAPETARILRKPSSEIAAILGYIDEPELIHRNNLVLLG